MTSKMTNPTELQTCIAVYMGADGKPLCLDSELFMNSTVYPELEEEIYLSRDQQQALEEHQAQLEELLYRIEQHEDIFAVLHP